MMGPGMQYSRVGDFPPPAPARTRLVIDEEICAWRTKRIEAAQDPTVSQGTFRSLSHFIDAAIEDLMAERLRAAQ